MPEPDSSTRNEHQHHKLDQEVERTRAHVETLEKELALQQGITEAASLFLEDVTLRTLVESLAEGLVVVEPHGFIVTVNQRAADMFGYKRDWLTGRPLSILLPERFVEAHARQIQAYFSEPHIRPMGIGLDLIGRRGDATEFPIEISLSHLETAAGPVGLAFISDISVRKQMELELLMRNNELEAFAHTLAHDLKGSLAVLVGFSQELADYHHTMTQETRHQYLTQMAKYGFKMDSIIDSLLLFASLRNEAASVSPIDDMRAVIDEVLERLHMMINENEVTFQMPAEFERVMGNAEWIEEVWLNYISNAIKYGGPGRQIEIGSRSLDNGYMEFWVRDQGPGLTAEEQEALFTEFSRLEEMQVDGTGLGLSIVKRIISRLGGEVGVRSQKGSGSTFYFTLPAVDAQH